MATRKQRILQIAERYGAHGLIVQALTENMSPAEFESLALRRHRQLALGGVISTYLTEIGRNCRSPSLDNTTADQLSEWSREVGEELDPRVLRLPWRVLRALTAGSATTGGYLAMDHESTPVGALRPYSVTARAGVTIIEGLRAGQTIAVSDTDIELTWLPADAATGPAETTPTFMGALATPKLASALVRFSRSLRLQSNVERFLATEFMKGAGRAIDRALTSGDGIGGEPIGILNTEGVDVESGTSFDRDSAIDMRAAVSAANTEDERIAFIGAHDVRTTLAKRPVVSGGDRFVWDGDRLADRTARVSSDVPTGALICGDWSTAYVLLWGSGLAIDFTEMQPDAFARGGVTGRVLVEIDVVLSRPAAFSIASSIT
jgi:HK97 family phage major capsid protein